MRLIILLYFLSIWTISFGQWSGQVSGTFEYLNAVQFLDSNNGYVAGNNGTILKTENSGMDWVTLTTNTNISLKSIYFLNHDIGYVCGNEKNHSLNIQEGILLKTIDGGKNWINLNFDSGEQLVNVYFIDSVVGFVSTLDKGLFKTVDGGKKWNLVKNSGTVKVFFSSKTVGYSLDQHSNGGGISKSTNGGLNWNQIKNDDSPDYTSARELESIFFTSDSIGFFGSRYYGGIYSTTDGGSSLSLSETQVVSIFFLSPTLGYMISNYDGTKIIQTIDSGNVWNQIFDSIIALRDLFFVNINKGWAVGANGNILHFNNLFGKVYNNDLQSKIRVYPNPSNDILCFEYPEGLHLTNISIFDINGKLAIQFDKKSKSADIGNLSKGQYSLMITSQNSVFTKIIIID